MRLRKIIKKWQVWRFCPHYCECHNPRSVSTPNLIIHHLSFFISRLSQTLERQVLYPPRFTLHFSFRHLYSPFFCVPTTFLTLTPLGFEPQTFVYESAALSVPPLCLSLDRWELKGLNHSRMIAVPFNFCITRLLGK